MFSPSTCDRDAAGTKVNCTDSSLLIRCSILLHYSTSMEKQGRWNKMHAGLDLHYTFTWVEHVLIWEKGFLPWGVWFCDRIRSQTVWMKTSETGVPGNVCAVGPMIRLFRGQKQPSVKPLQLSKRIKIQIHILSERTLLLVGHWR